jgi:adenosine deaminase
MGRTHKWMMGFLHIQIGLALCPVSNDALFLKLDKSPIGRLCGKRIAAAFLLEDEQKLCDEKVFLPRQTPDRELSQKKTRQKQPVFLGIFGACVSHHVGEFFRQGLNVSMGTGKKTCFCAPLPYIKDDDFTKTGSGQA